MEAWDKLKFELQPGGQLRKSVAQLEYPWKKEVSKTLNRSEIKIGRYRRGGIELETSLEPSHMRPELRRVRKLRSGSLSDILVIAH